MWLQVCMLHGLMYLLLVATCVCVLVHVCICVPATVAAAVCIRLSKGARNDLTPPHKEEMPIRRPVLAQC